MLQTSRDFSSNATARVLARCRSATERTGRPAATLPRAAPERSEPKNLRRTTSLAFAGSGDVGVRVAQVVLHGPLGDAEGTADAEAESSPAWTRRYTVIFETRIIEATSATVRKVTAARGWGTTGRPTGMAAGCAAGTGRPTAEAGIGRPSGRGPGTPGRAMAGACARWGMVMSIVSGPSSSRGAGFPTGN